MSQPRIRIDPATGEPFPLQADTTESAVFVARAFGSGLDQDGEGYLVFEAADGQRLYVRITSERFIDAMIGNLEEMRQRMYHVDGSPPTPPG